MSDSSTITLHDCEVVSNEQVAQGLMRVVFACRPLSEQLRAGQFVNLEVPGDRSQILRLPLSFSHADPEAGTFEIVYAVVGDGTGRLSRMAPGATTTAVGPCGNPWPVSEGQGRCLVVSGGVGVTPIVACARLLRERGVAFDAVVGAQTGARVWGVDVLESLGAGRVSVTTDDGTMGRRGFTTDELRDLLAANDYDTVYACGPEPMMAGVARLCAEAGVECRVSMERMMCCGFGACGTCNLVLVSGGYASVCKNGPVFDAKEVAW